MCTTHTSLLYGIIVKTWSLYIAAKAHRRIVPVALALDMIMARVGNGRLVVADNGKVLPMEIWATIKKELYEVQIYDTEAKELAIFLDPLRAFKLDEAFIAYGWPLIVPRTCASLDALTIYNPDQVSVWLDRNDYEYLNYKASIEDSLDRPDMYWFLKDHGFSTANSPLGGRDIDSMDTLLSPIAIDTPLNPGLRPLESIIDHDGPGSASVALIPSDRLSARVSTRRFKQLVRNYRLDLAPNDSVPSFNSVRDKRVGALSNSGTVKISDDVEQEGVRLVVKPRWMLWSDSTACM